MNYLIETTVLMLVLNAEVELQRTAAVTNPSDNDGVEETTVTGLRGEGERGFCF